MSTKNFNFIRKKLFNRVVKKQKIFYLICNKKIFYSLFYQNLLKIKLLNYYKNII